MDLYGSTYANIRQRGMDFYESTYARVLQLGMDFYRSTYANVHQLGMDLYESTYANIRQPGPAPDMRADQHRLNTYKFSALTASGMALDLGPIFTQSEATVHSISGLPCQRQQRLFQLVIQPCRAW